jgi:hypothetical protein
MCRLARIVVSPSTSMSRAAADRSPRDVALFETASFERHPLSTPTDVRRRTSGVRVHYDLGAVKHGTRLMSARDDPSNPDTTGRRTC